jgi:hypothetical protein
MASQAIEAPRTPRKKSPKPSIRETVNQRMCPNCGRPSPERISARGGTPLYCRDRPCRRELNNRNVVQGASLVPYLKAWRADRGSGEIAQASFMRICNIVDALLDDDRRANRPHARYHAATLIASNAQPVDELRYGWRKMEESRRQKGDVDAEQPKPKRDNLAALRSRVDDPKTTDNERAVLAAALEILSQKDDAE